MGIRLHFFLIALSLLGSPSFSSAAEDPATVRWITDYDDTLQLSAVKGSIWQSIECALSAVPFAGVKGLAQEVFSRTHWEILSAKLTFLGALTNRFFERIEVQPESFWTKDSLSESNYDFKVRILRQIAQETDDGFLLFGDDGEQDSLVYQTIQEEYPERVREVYIRNVYSTGAAPHQIRILTSLDVAISEWNAGRVSRETALSIATNVSRANEGRLWPEFALCPAADDVIWEQSRSRTTDPEIQALQLGVIERIEQICRNRSR